MRGSIAVHDVAVGALRAVPARGPEADEVRAAVEAGLLRVGPGNVLDLTDDGRASLGLCSFDGDGADIGGQG